MKPNKEPYDCIIIGGGPGGLVSALYLRRYRRKILVINGGKPRADRIPKIHNLLACPEGISGRELISRLHEQLRELGTDFLTGEAKLQKRKNGFAVKVGKKTFAAKKVILATGMKDEDPEIEHCEDLCLENVIAYCPVCDGYEYSDQTIGILVKDARGMRKLRFIASFSPDIKLIIIGNAKISPKQRKLLEELGADIHRGELVDLAASEVPKGVLIHLKDAEPIFVRALYIELGARVQDEAFKSLPRLKRTRKGYLRVSCDQETSVKGVYAVGDCVNDLSQISVAAGHAAIAATAIHNSLLAGEKVWTTLNHLAEHSRKAILRR